MTLPVFLVEEFTRTTPGYYQFPAPVIRAVAAFDGQTLFKDQPVIDWKDAAQQERMLDIMTEKCASIFEHTWIQVDEGNKVMRCPPSVSMHPLTLEKDPQNGEHAPWVGIVVLFDRNGNFRETATSDRKEFLQDSARLVAERWQAYTGCETAGISGRPEFLALHPIIDAACPHRKCLYQWPLGRHYSTYQLENPSAFYSLAPHLIELLPHSHLQSDTARVDNQQRVVRL